MNRIYNFSAGPSMLPKPVLQHAAKEMLNYKGSGQSVMEMSHRSKVFAEIFESTKESFKRIMKIPNNYTILFLQGGASAQFSAVPMNLLTNSGKADYVISGIFSSKAYKEAIKYGDIKLVGSSQNENYRRIPNLDEKNFRSYADYFHICLNNTVYGTEWKTLPKTGKVPLVADVSSCILSKPTNIPEFGLLYAGAQKNIAPAGLTIVIVRNDLIHEPLPFTPTTMCYQTMANANSMYNTPPCWSIYICSLVLEWIENEIGGLENMAQINAAKSAVLYDFLDNSKIFMGYAAKDNRSKMNVTFTTGDEFLDKKFIKESERAGFVNLKGHRSVGGMRASIYNAMPKVGVERLVEFMKHFEEENS